MFSPLQLNYLLLALQPDSEQMGVQRRRRRVFAFRCSFRIKSIRVLQLLRHFLATGSSSASIRCRRIFGTVDIVDSAGQAVSIGDLGVLLLGRDRAFTMEFISTLSTLHVQSNMFNICYKWDGTFKKLAHIVYDLFEMITIFYKINYKVIVKKIKLITQVIKNNFYHKIF
ncbi:hypothetical protein IEQ34_021523 [Dendrobium chrysotoxum]|uniref:Uncharacterized protein n=1 Tax=Dendrobium chrysotoxum TaxID=161865 RepID=A0AAV7G3S2_DENCH|nr:hypothetical protein IEQ34_021523 [Dendrobium chrysotoxum]